VAGETLTAALLNAELRDNLNAAEPIGSLHYYIRAATTTETTINGFALECNAVNVTRTTYSALNTLLSALSYPFGNGNGTTTMTLPDVQGRSLVAMASGGHANVNGLGDSDGLAKASRTPKEQVSSAGNVVNSAVGVTLGGPTSTASASQVGPPTGTFADGSHGHTVTAASLTDTTVSVNGTLVGSFVVAGVWAVKY
jgi:hypothetical protein